MGLGLSAGASGLGRRGSDDRPDGGRRALSPAAAGPHRRRPSRRGSRCGRVSDRDRHARARDGDPQKRNDLGRRCDLAYLLASAARRTLTMMTRIKGGRVIDPAARPRRRRRYLDRRRTDRRGTGRPRRRGRDLRCRRQDRHGRRDRHPFPYCRHQRDGSASAAAGISSGRGGQADRPSPGRPSRPDAAMREMGFTHGRRAGGRAASRAARASRARRHSDHRQGNLVRARQRRLFARLMRARESAAAVRDYVAWSLETSRALGIKVINAGGAMAFKANVRAFSLDDVVPDYGVSSRDIVKTLQNAVCELGVPHPLHVHCNNLGLPGSAETALATIEAAEGGRSISRTCSSTATARKASAASRPPPRGSPRR